WSGSRSSRTATAERAHNADRTCVTYAPGPRAEEPVTARMRRQETPGTVVVDADVGKAEERRAGGEEGEAPMRGLLPSSHVTSRAGIIRRPGIELNDCRGSSLRRHRQIPSELLKLTPFFGRQLVFAELNLDLPEIAGELERHLRVVVVDHRRPGV